ncbi:uncharacterized protein B0H18DRAFT_994120 [Fomitopsis serialis]|uniref:uncharacterized protein n=1 Tax=Fomitopsis serialis TaxID=139415 RepID=UPI002007D9F7|nr:uncharacterized protein B0H18DRAFT_994120 [Neoantrodia serialis]KAH9930275.1 hypothetical protein B0H18DRAFT_994120 [Neoantrodia serialis]
MAPTARYYLFGYVRLTARRAYDRFVDTLNHSTDLPTHVRTLTIKKCHNPYSSSFDISPVLLRATQLSHLHLRIALGVTVRTSRLVNTVYPKLSTIILAGGTYHGLDILRLLRACPDLRDLCLMDPQQPDIPPSGIKKLVFLRVSGLALRVKFQLQHLEMEGNLVADNPCPQILWDSQSSLRSLVLHHSPDIDIDHTDAETRSLRLSSLRSLSFEPATNLWEWSPDYIIDMLNVTNADCIEDIRLSFILPCYGGVDFKSVDEALGSSTRPNVRITVAIVFGGQSISYRHDVVSDVLQGFPLLRERGPNVTMTLTDQYGRFPKEIIRY